MDKNKLEKYMDDMEDIVRRLKESDLSKFTSSDTELVKELLKQAVWVGDLLKENEPK